MGTIARRAEIRAAPIVLWKTIADPRMLPAWWPGVERVEGVDRLGFTQVLRSSRGRLVRADYRRIARREPERIVWEQRLEGTPFAQVFAYRALSVTLDPAAGGGTLVEIAVEQRFHGAARYVRALNTRGVRRQLDQALAALREHHEHAE